MVLLVEAALPPCRCLRHNHPNAQDLVHGIQYSCNPYFYQVFRHIVKNSSEGTDPNRIVPWNRHMMLTALHGCYSNMTAGLSGDLIAEDSEGSS